MDRAFCNECGRLVPAGPVERAGRVFLVKRCPDCGTTETLASADAERYMGKRALDADHKYMGCALNCLNCAHKQRPSFVFVDVTNRCNQNCPICINNTPSMGFLFEPPLSYFEELFRQIAQYDPRPTVQLFGGEPTVRDDLFEIIEMARKRFGLRVRIVTNGLKLADEEYCRRLVASKVTILIAYDGADPRAYEVLRGSAKILDRKKQAIENLRKCGAKKVCFMTCVAKGFNDHEMGPLLALCHELRDTVRGVYYLPLAQTWDLAEFSLEPERITSEDIELILAQCFPGERIDFLPAGILGSIPTLMERLHVRHPPFMGAHPNCESFYLLVSDGERYVPIGRYYKRPLSVMLPELIEADARLCARVERLEGSAAGRALERLGVKDAVLTLMAGAVLMRFLVRNTRILGMVRGRGLGRLGHVLGALGTLLTGRGMSKALELHTVLGRRLQLIVLPFEDNSLLETERLERCPNAFAFYDPEDGIAKSVPVCAWGQHKTRVLRGIADYYAGARAARPADLTGGA